MCAHALLSIGCYCHFLNRQNNNQDFSCWDQLTVQGRLTVALCSPGCTLAVPPDELPP